MICSSSDVFVASFPAILSVEELIPNRWRLMGERKRGGCRSRLEQLVFGGGRRRRRLKLCPNLQLPKIFEDCGEFGLRPDWY